MTLEDEEMFPCQLEMMEESTRLYEELTTLRVTDSDAVYFLNNPEEFFKREKELTDYQKRLHSSRIRDDTRDAYMEDSLIYLGRLNNLRKHMRVQSSETNASSNNSNFSVRDFLAGTGLGVGIGLPLGAYLTMKIYQSQDENAIREAGKIFTELQKYQQQMPAYASPMVDGISSAVNEMKTKADDVNSEVMKLVERLKAIEEDLEKKKAEKNAVRKNGRKK
jgi:uncharacterized coiled-coil protein SlyX